jgi:hypothetical protein
MHGDNQRDPFGAPSETLSREAQRLRGLADRLSGSDPDDAAACLLAAAVLESMTPPYAR